MKNIMVFLIAGLTIISCGDQVDKKTVGTERFSIIIPSGWTFEEAQGYDSFVREIRINEREKISIDLGAYSSNLNVDNSTHDIVFKTIDNKAAKVVSPKKSEKGITGVYFDSIDVDKTKFQMSGTDLSTRNRKLLLAAIETLKFR